MKENLTNLLDKSPNKTFHPNVFINAKNTFTAPFKKVKNNINSQNSPMDQDVDVQSHYTSSDELVPSQQYIESYEQNESSRHDDVLDNVQHNLNNSSFCQEDDKVNLKMKDNLTYLLDKSPNKTFHPNVFINAKNTYTAPFKKVNNNLSLQNSSIDKDVDEYNQDSLDDTLFQEGNTVELKPKNNITIFPDAVPYEKAHHTWNLQNSSIEKSVDVQSHYTSFDEPVFSQKCCKTYALNRRSYAQLSIVERTYISNRFPHVARSQIVCEKATTQPDSTRCGAHSAANAVAIALGEDPSTIHFSQDAQKMREHMVKIIREEKISPFPRE
ncbi:hypothetical protein HCN44_000827 [Aphidius gifuensis]|uniref:Uncharacterized protein n=1 Tax=Aphidius gifuensis TaxID=684658 RepID=A0A835CP83_APHGI|nr:hypothetical protein HCN44_000827 [Aphidius gifuensis]